MIGQFAGHSRDREVDPMDLGLTGKHVRRAQGQT
jgi:hypothetical protein